MNYIITTPTNLYIYIHLFIFAYNNYYFPHNQPMAGQRPQPEQRMAGRTTAKQWLKWWPNNNGWGPNNDGRTWPEEQGRFRRRNMENKGKQRRAEARHMDALFGLCNICGGDDLHGGYHGFFYCSTCGSQSQRFQEQALDYDSLAAYTRRSNHAYVPSLPQAFI